MSARGEQMFCCPDCLGDGGFPYFTGTYCHQTGAADEGWDKCRLCDGTGGVPFEVWADFQHAEWSEAFADDPGWTPDHTPDEIELRKAG